MRTVPHIATSSGLQFSFCSFWQLAEAHTSPVAILGAFDEEVTILEGQLVNPNSAYD